MGVCLISFDSYDYNIQNKLLTRVSSDPDTNSEPLESQANTLTQPTWPLDYLFLEGT